MIGRIDGTDIYLPEDQLPAITLSINDLTDPSKMRGPRSTTMKLVNTKEARRVFSDQYMNSPSRTPGSVLTIGDGSVDLFRASVVPTSTDRDTIEAMALAGNATWFEAAKNTKLKDLLLGVSSPIDTTAQQATWTGVDTMDYYPLINYGGLDGRAATYNVTTQYLRPALRAWKVLEVFFRSIGYTVSARGTFAKHFKRFVIPNVHDKNIAAQVYLESKSVQQELVVSAPYTQGTAVPTDTINVDPAGIATSGYMSITPIVGTRYRVTVDGNVTITKLSISSPTKLFIYVRDMTALANPIFKIVDIPTGNLVEVVQLKNLVLGEFDIVSGRTYELQMVCLGPTAGTTTLALDSIRTNWDMVVAEYTEGIILDLASCAPDMTVMDVINGMSGSQFLITDTVNYGNEVRLWYDTEFFRTPAPGVSCRDWTQRLDHTNAPSKEEGERPKRVEYRWKEDSGDVSLKDADRRNPSPGYGNYDDVIGGFGAVQRVEVPFAATAMGIVLEGLRVPVMRDERAAYQTDVFSRTPRLLYADGVADGDWKLDGVDLTEYPRCYFAGTGSAHPVGFANVVSVGDELAAQTASVYGSRRMRQMRSARVLEAFTVVRDNEVQDFDHGMPTLVDDSSGPAWYYVQEVSNHRIGKNITTKVRYLEVMGTAVDPDAVTPDNDAIEYPEIIVNPPFVPPCTNAPRFPNTPTLVSYRVSASSQAAVEADTTNFPVGMSLVIACLSGGGSANWDAWVGDVVQRVAPGTGTDGSAWQRLNLVLGSIVENADYASPSQWDRYLITSSGFMTFYGFRLMSMDPSGNWIFDSLYDPCGEVVKGRSYIWTVFADACRRFQIQANTTTDQSTGWVDVGDDLFMIYGSGTVPLPPGALYARVKYMRGPHLQGYSDRTLIV